MVASRRITEVGRLRSGRGETSFTRPKSMLKNVEMAWTRLGFAKIYERHHHSNGGERVHSNKNRNKTHVVK